jgi:hypothetical protein
MAVSASEKCEPKTEIIITTFQWFNSLNIKNQVAPQYASRAFNGVTELIWKRQSGQSSPPSRPRIARSKWPLTVSGRDWSDDGDFVNGEPFLWMCFNHLPFICMCFNPFQIAPAIPTNWRIQTSFTHLHKLTAHMQSTSYIHQNCSNVV